MYYKVVAEAVGQIGTNHIMDISKHPPVVQKVHIEFDDWLGDDIVQNFPIYLITNNLYILLKNSALTGFEIDACEVSTSENFKILNNNMALPQFYWFKITGLPLKDDFWLSEKTAELIVSDNALSLLKKRALNNCDISKYKHNWWSKLFP